MQGFADFYLTNKLVFLLLHLHSKQYLHWQRFLTETFKIKWRDYATLLALATLGDVTQV
jgi:hypothetical protein